jgi:acetylornithine deacetylase/succinyl-diaminopimelate desuccinylase-like protein
MASPQPAIGQAYAQREEYMAGFIELLSIPSVSTDPAFKKDLERCGDWIVAEMKRIGFKNCRKIPTAGHPALYGEWLEAGDDKPTVLIYAHYDVQPVDPLNLWTTPPFEPSERDGKLYARGAVDDKAGVFVNLKALESILVVDGKLPVNVKLIFEGEEESGSPNMYPFVKANKDLLKADALILCDGGFDRNLPTITYSGRGIVGAEVSITCADHDLHSGVYGGVVHNPLHVAGTIIGSFHDAEGRVALPGYYDAVKKLPDDELAYLTTVWETLSTTYNRDSGTAHYWGESIAPVPVRATALPTLEVNGMWGGYQGPGTKTVIPSKAGFKVTMRLVSDQDPNEIAEMFRNYVLGFASDTAAIEVSVLAEGYPLKGLFDGPLVEAVQKALVATTGKRALMERTGGSIPIAGMFQRELGIPMTTLGLGAGEVIHAPDEFIRIDEFYLAIDTAINLYYNLAELKPGN